MKSDSSIPAPPRDDSALHSPPSALKWVLLLTPLLYLWFRLINNLRTEWETNPQYSYGYIVPFLCLGLLLHRWQALRSQPATSLRPSTFDIQLFRKSPFSVFCFLLFAFLSFLYLPTRLIELATPEWRPIQWALGIIAIGLTLLAVSLGWGRQWLRTLAFPLCFFLVAIPWPTLIEQPIIQSLTRINAALVIEVMGLIGVPALQHGNVIEVGTGVVGIDEACSGIRSFQSSIMISLFLGALYDLPLVRRLLFVPIGFVLAMIFNLARTSFLTYVAAKEGVSAIDKYHDPAGLWIMVGCTAGLWLIGLMMRPTKPKKPSATAESISGKEGIEKLEISPRPALNPQLSTLNRVCLFLLVWLLFVEFGAHTWYRTREARLPQGPNWSVIFPHENSTFRELPMAPATFNLLRFDDGKQGAWTEPDGTAWQAFYFNWQPGRVAGYLAKRHTPEICMPATGREMLAGPELMVLEIHGLELPVRRYRFGPDGNSWHVYHCRWESGAARGSFVEQESARFNLIRGIWAGRGNQGQKIIQILISGTEDPEAAQALLTRRLTEMIKVETTQAQSNAEN
jgi:exosortase